MSKRSISIKRTHGLGNIIMLLPILNSLVEQGFSVELVTIPRWVSTFSVLCPSISFTHHLRKSSVDLDEMTLHLKLKSSKAVAFAELLGVREFETSEVSVEVPSSWKKPFESSQSSIGFAPEAGHKGRRWPERNSSELASKLVGAPLSLIGWETDPQLQSDFDFRGVPLEGLFGSISCLRALVSMDSGAMHVARLLRIPTVALFGGIDPQIVTEPTDSLIALQSGLSCFPCNKNETCGGTYDCIAGIRPEHVIDALSRVDSTHCRVIVSVP